ncbi:MAG: putative polyketide biosynthesis zinc-dependent hydrolase PksB, partial [Planctomycetota bacterium]
KKFNYALQPMPFEQFKQMVTSDQPEAPEYFVYDAIKNRQERPDLDATLRTSLRGLSLDETLAMQRDGAQLVDVREAIDFEAAHLRGSLNIGLKGKYATWCGSILSHDRPIVVISEAGSEEEAVMRLGRIGFDHVAGYLKDGLAAVEKRPDLLQTIPRMTAQALAEQRDAGNDFYVIDVRSEKEYRGGHIPGGHNIPVNHLRDHLSQIPLDRPIVVHCEGGYRSAIAASLIAEAGRGDVWDLVGGIKAWHASKLPVETSAAT